MKLNYLTPLAFVSLAAHAPAALTWTGASNGVSLYQEGNWLDDNNAIPGANTIDGGADVTAATGGLILIAGGTGTPSNYAPNFQIGSGNDLTVSNGKTLGSGSGSTVVGGGSGSTLSVNNGANILTGTLSQFDHINVTGVSTIDLVGTAGISMFSGNQSTFNISNNSSVVTQFISNGGVINVDGTSSLQFLGTGTPINTVTVNLAPGAELTLATVAEFTEQGNKIFVGGVSYNSDNSILSFNGTTATAVPEPSSALLISIGGLALLRRKR